MCSSQVCLLRQSGRVSVETSHLTALLLHGKNVNRKTAGSSKINVRRDEMHGLGYIDDRHASIVANMF